VKDKQKEREEVENLTRFSNEPTIWEEDAKRTQQSASDVHRHQKSKLGLAGPPIASPALGMHERRAVEIRKSRTQGDVSYGYRGTY